MFGFFKQKFCIFALKRIIEDEDQLQVRFTLYFWFNKRKMILIFNTLICSTYMQICLCRLKLIPLFWASFTESKLYWLTGLVYRTSSMIVITLIFRKNVFVSTLSQVFFQTCFPIINAYYKENWNTLCLFVSFKCPNTLHVLR